MTALELIYGQHAVHAVLSAEPQRIQEAWLQRGRDNRLSRALAARAEAGHLALHVLPRARLDELFPDVRHQGVVVRARARAAESFDGLLANLSQRPSPLLLLLDGVEDPHNLGACLRSADAAGVEAVIVPRSRGVGLTGVVRKVASGAAERVPLVPVANLARAMRSLQDIGICIVGTTADAPRELYETDLRGPLALVLGAEGGGLRALTVRHCDVLARLPMHGSVASLNVSVAAGICLYEAVRQRRN